MSTQPSHGSRSFQAWQGLRPVGYSQHVQVFESPGFNGICCSGGASELCEEGMDSRLRLLRGRLCAGITMALRRPHRGMKMASSVGMVEADPAPGPSLGPRDDRAGWPGAIFMVMTVWMACTCRDCGHAATSVRNCSDLMRQRNRPFLHTGPSPDDRRRFLTPLALRSE